MKTFTKFFAGVVAILALEMIGCQTDTDTHEHTYSTEWSKDATNHWHAATCEHTTEVSDKAAHTFDEAVVTKETKTYTCTVCNYQRSVAVGDIIYTETAQQVQKTQNLHQEKLQWQLWQVSIQTAQY